jgi:hypothetical protein
MALKRRLEETAARTAESRWSAIKHVVAWGVRRR